MSSFSSFLRHGDERTDHSDDGFSLPELLVSMIVGSVVLAAVAAVFTSAIRTSRETTATISGTSEVRNALDLMSRRLRVAILPASGSSFEKSLPNDVVFYSSIVSRGTTADPVPSKVEYVFDATKQCLRENITPPVTVSGSITYPASAMTTKCIAFGNVNRNGTSPMFSYYDLGTSTTVLPADASGNVAVPDSIDSIGITLQVSTLAGSRQLSPTVTTRVTLTNLNIAGGL